MAEETERECRKSGEDQSFRRSKPWLSQGVAFICVWVFCYCSGPVGPATMRRRRRRRRDATNSVADVTPSKRKSKRAGWKDPEEEEGGHALVLV